LYLVKGDEKDRPDIGSKGDRIRQSYLVVNVGRQCFYFSDPKLGNMSRISASPTQAVEGTRGSKGR
jgi:hypothetical protein